MPIYTLEDLVFALISEIGLGITPDGFLYDQDSNIILLYNGHQIRASVNPCAPAIATDIYAAFDPVFDPKIMQMILGYYAHKREIEGEPAVLTMSETIEDIPFYNDFENRKTKRSMMTVILEGGKSYYSNYYYQKGLKYSDVILRMGNHPYPDLSKFDSVPEDSIIGAIRC